MGRNPELSKAEIKALLGNVIIAERENAVLVEVGEPIEGGFVDRLGGTVVIGIVVDFDRFVYEGESNKLTYVVWDYSARTSEFEDELKKRFRADKMKVTQKKISGLIDLQGGGEVSNLSSRKLIDEEYFVFDSKDRTYFGVIVQRSSHEDLEARDMNKPVRREELSISPRLAKIMINLSGVQEGQKLVDPFCGIGVILSEALIQDLKVIGIDKDKSAIDGAVQNLKWFNFSEDDYVLVNEDSRRARINRANVVVTEPNLGKILKKMPTSAQTKKTLDEFENLIVKVFNNLKKKVKGRFVFSAPLFKTIDGRKGCSIVRIASKTEMKIVIDGIPEFRKDQIVGREIFVLE